MMGKTHAVTGAVAFLAASPLLALDGPGIAAGTAMAAGAALLPDIDHPSSTVARTLGPFRFVTKGIARVTGGHRHATHSLLGLAAFIALTIVLTQATGEFRTLGPVAVGIGSAAHLAGDFLTPGGVPWLWPLPGRYSLPIVVTGSWLERLVRTVLYGLGVWLAVNVFGAWPYVHAGIVYLAG